jgi:hypothetical protein
MSRDRREKGIRGASPVAGFLQVVVVGLECLKGAYGDAPDAAPSRH